jgi:hypothetical protein
MKDWRKTSGWLVKMVGGPNDGVYMRSWTLDSDPLVAAENLMPAICVWAYGEIGQITAIDTRGYYQLRETLKKDGSRKTAKVKGVDIPASHYEWQELP